jgi:hypothetical protein
MTASFPAQKKMNVALGEHVAAPCRAGVSNDAESFSESFGTTHRFQRARTMTIE